MTIEGIRNVTVFKSSGKFQEESQLTFQNHDRILR